MLITPLSPDTISKLAELNFEKVYKAWNEGEELIFTYANGNVIKKPIIRFLYNHLQEDNINEYYSTNLPGCIISENDGEDAFNKMIWGVIECLDCRYSLSKIDSRIYLTGHVYHFKDYTVDLTNSTIETLSLENELVTLGFNKIYSGISINIYFKSGNFSTLCIPNNLIKPLIPLDLYYTFKKLTFEISKSRWHKMYGPF